jgi:hypothetical protein
MKILQPTNTQRMRPMKKTKTKLLFMQYPNHYCRSFFVLTLLAVLLAASPLFAAPGDFLKQHNLKFVSLKFFEGPEVGPAFGARSYQVKFPQASTRHIFWELRLEAAGPRTAAVPFAIDTLWYDPAGKLLKEATERFTLEKSHQRAWYTHAYGYPLPGHWKPGKYRVVLKINGKEVASGSFEITPAPKPR